LNTLVINDIKLLDLLIFYDSRPDEAHPGALLALCQGVQLQQVLKTGKLVQHKSIVSFRNLRSDVQSLLANIERSSGVKVN
jgi:hypothetical protein